MSKLYQSMDTLKGWVEDMIDNKISYGYYRELAKLRQPKQ
jgi:hypothetical protein